MQGVSGRVKTRRPSTSNAVLFSSIGTISYSPRWGRPPPATKLRLLIPWLLVKWPSQSSSGRRWARTQRALISQKWGCFRCRTSLLATAPPTENLHLPSAIISNSVSRPSLLRNLKRTSVVRIVSQLQARTLLAPPASTATATHRPQPVSPPGARAVAASKAFSKTKKHVQTATRC